MKPNWILFGLFLGLASAAWAAEPRRDVWQVDKSVQPYATYPQARYCRLRHGNARPVRDDARRTALAAGRRLENGSGLADSPPPDGLAGWHHGCFQKGLAVHHGQRYSDEAPQTSGLPLRRRLDDPLRHRKRSTPVVCSVPLGNAPGGHGTVDLREYRQFAAYAPRRFQPKGSGQAGRCHGSSLALWNAADSRASTANGLHRERKRRGRCCTLRTVLAAEVAVDFGREKTLRQALFLKRSGPWPCILRTRSWTALFRGLRCGSSKPPSNG